MRYTGLLIQPGSDVRSEFESHTTRHGRWFLSKHLGAMSDTLRCWTDTRIIYRGMRLRGAGEGCEPFANGFDTHISPQIGESMDVKFLVDLLRAMVAEQSGISDYWRNRIKEELSKLPIEPRNMVEVVEDEEPPVANEVIAAD